MTLLLVFDASHFVINLSLLDLSEGKMMLCREGRMPDLDLQSTPKAWMSQTGYNIPPISSKETRMKQPIDDTWEDGHHSMKLVKSNKTRVAPQPQDPVAHEAAQSQRNLFNIIAGFLQAQPGAVVRFKVISLCHSQNWVWTAEWESEAQCLNFIRSRKCQSCWKPLYSNFQLGLFLFWSDKLVKRIYSSTITPWHSGWIIRCPKLAISAAALHWCMLSLDLCRLFDCQLHTTFTGTAETTWIPSNRTPRAIHKWRAFSCMSPPFFILQKLTRSRLCQRSLLPVLK